MRTLLFSRDVHARLSVLLLMAAGLAGPVLHPAVHGAMGEGAHHEEAGHDEPAPAEAPSDQADCALCVVSSAPPAHAPGAPAPAYLVVASEALPEPAWSGPALNRSLPPRAPPAG